MTAVIYNCTTCKTGRRVVYPHGRRSAPYRIANDGARILPGQAFGGDGKRTGDAVCGCGRFMSWGVLDATRRDEVRCDARCTNARGHKCDCSCGGENHGEGWQVGARGLFTNAPA